MYEFHHDYLKNKYGNKLRLLFTNTDSLMYEIEAKDVYEGFSKDKKIFDFSIYLTKSTFYADFKNLVVGKMEYEIAGVPMKEFLGLKLTIYSFLVDDRVNIKNQKM